MDNFVSSSVLPSDSEGVSYKPPQKKKICPEKPYHAFMALSRLLACQDLCLSFLHFLAMPCQCLLTAFVCTGIICSHTDFSQRNPIFLQAPQ